MTKSEIIKETAQFYGEDTSRRSLKSDSDLCLYLGTNGKRCAFSRCCVEDKENDEILMDSEESTASTAISNGAKVKPEYAGHSADFWEDLQSLHDRQSCWDENGLTELGKEEVERLLERYQD